MTDAPPGLVLGRECGRIRDVREIALRRTRALDLGDDRHFLAPEDPEGILGFRLPGCSLFERIHGRALLANLEVLQNAGDDSVENAHDAGRSHSPMVAARR